MNYVLVDGLPAEIASDYAPGCAPAPRPAPIQKDPTRASASFAVGDQVSHKTFGPGIVLAVQGDTIEVKFTRTNKTKKLMKGFAPIVKIEG